MILGVPGMIITYIILYGCTKESHSGESEHTHHNTTTRIIDSRSQSLLHGWPASPYASRLREPSLLCPVAPFMVVVVLLLPAQDKEGGPSRGRSHVTSTVRVNNTSGTTAMLPAVSASYLVAGLQSLQDNNTTPVVSINLTPNQE